MKHGERWIAAAVLYVEKYGLSVIPMSIDKRPCVKWKEYQERKPTIRELLHWPKQNLGIITGKISNLVVVDCESLEDAQWFWTHRSRSPSVVKTRRGYHLYFRHPDEPVQNATHVENRYDVRADGGYVLAPPSLHSEGSYQWTKWHGLVATDKLPAFNPQWRPPTPSSQTTSDRKIRDGVAYISKIHAVAGQGGHSDTFRAAVRLRQAELTESEALLAMQEWNRTNANPPWSDKELLHKVTGAYHE